MAASLLHQFLTADVAAQLRGTSDAVGFTFAQAIASGEANPDSEVGVYAGSQDSYLAFAPLLDPIIAAYHGPRRHEEGIDVDAVPQLSSRSASAVVSTRMRVARNLAGVPLVPAITLELRREVARRVEAELSELAGDMSGAFHFLAALDDATREQLVADHFLFKDGDRFLEAAGGCRDWPDGRAIFHNHDKTFLVWVNEEDHLRIISMESGGDMRSVLARLQEGLSALGGLGFARDERLGYITSCPTNLGTGLRASVHVRLPMLSQEEIAVIAAEHALDVRGVHGEHSDAEGGVWDISNKRRLGYTETDLVAGMVRGVEALVAADQA